jgi:hypothetical protein
LDELIVIPFAGLGELDVERLSVGRIIFPVKVPVTWVITVIQSPLPNWIGYGSLSTWTSGKMPENCSIAAACAAVDQLFDRSDRWRVAG